MPVMQEQTWGWRQIRAFYVKIFVIFFSILDDSKILVLSLKFIKFSIFLMEMRQSYEPCKDTFCPRVAPGAWPVSARKFESFF